MQKSLLLATLTALSACAMLPVSGGSSPAVLRTAADGLRPANSALRIDFDRSQDGVVAAVSRLLEAAPESRFTNAECGAGPVTTVSWAAGLDLMFQHGSFAGWTADTAQFVTVTGYAPGQSRASLSGAGVTFQTTSLGTEFEVDGVFGLIQGEAADSPVDLMWAGVTCFFR